MGKRRQSSSGSMRYLVAHHVQDVRITEPPQNRSRTGYGGKIGTAVELRIGKRWYRVYSHVYSNMPTSYIVREGENVYLGPFSPYDWLRMHGRTK